VTSYRELVEVVSFLSVMNKRHMLLFRGQGQKIAPLPVLFRKAWKSPFTEQIFRFDERKYDLIFDHLNAKLCPAVCQFLLKEGVPRPRMLKHYREAVWAVVQHYELWPRPLLDLTPNLRVAASFTLFEGRRDGFLYVAAMPQSTDSITFSADQQIIQARLAAACPPAAIRAHFQDGYLVGRFPQKEPGRDVGWADVEDKSNLNRRLAACIPLQNPGGDKSFWDAKNFRVMTREALMPEGDPLLSKFRSLFGPDAGAASVDEAMKEICAT
jgi:hypothetical protein